MYKSSFDKFNVVIAYCEHIGRYYKKVTIGAKTRLILDEMCRLYGKFTSYLRRVLCKKLIFSRINGPNDPFLPYIICSYRVLDKKFLI